MAHAWFLFNGNSTGDGSGDPSNYSLSRMQPDYAHGTELGAIYAEIQFVSGKIRPYIPTELQNEISIAKLIQKPSSNVLLKNT